MKRNRQLFYILIVIVILIILLFYNTKTVEQPDYSIRNPHRYLSLNTFTLPESFCNRQSFLVVIVYSEAANVRTRKSIRNSWGQDLNNILNHTVILYFLVLETRDSSSHYAISLETAQFDDVIQELFIDSDENYMTLKFLLTLKLANNYCYHSSKYLLIVEDDILVNLRNVVQMLITDGSPDLLMGHLVCGAKPVRNPKNRLYVPYHVYPQRKYPNFLAGGVYLMSVEVARKLYRVASETPLLPIEDIYITGICAKKAHITPRHNDLLAETTKELVRDKCVLKKLYAVYNLNHVDIKKLHSVILTGDWPKTCTIKAEETAFSSAKWVFNKALKFKDNPFNYRKICK